MSYEPIWVDPPDTFAALPLEEKYRTLLILVRGELCAAIDVPLKPDAKFHVLQLNPGADPDGDLLSFTPAFVSAFESLGQSFTQRLTTAELAAAEDLIASNQVGELSGASPECLAVVVPTRLRIEAREAISALFRSHDAVFVPE